MAARKALNGEPAWFITGGAAGVIAPIAPIPFVEVPLLVLEGLAHATRDYTNT
jgi:pantothenate kinase type III